MANNKQRSTTVNQGYKRGKMTAGTNALNILNETIETQKARLEGEQQTAEPIKKEPILPKETISTPTLEAKPEEEKDIIDEIKNQSELEDTKENKSYLQENRKKAVSLGCGLHKGEFYFGTKVVKEGIPYDAVVTSSKKIYVNKQRRTKNEIFGENEIRERFGLNYKDEFFDESLDNIFTSNAINKWCFGDTEDITLENVYRDLIGLFKEYIYLDEERKYSILAFYRIAGFFMPLWKTRARLFIHAEMGTAKSRLTQMLHNTGFNSVSLGDWTLPYIKAIIESTRGEAHIDDFETLPEEQKNATIRMIKVGYMSGFKAGKMSDGAKRKPEVSDLFNTTTINNTEGLDFITIDRCLPFRIPKIASKDYDKEPCFEEQVWEIMRDNLYILGLKYAQEVKETYKQIKSNKLRGRLFSIAKPELTIAKLISDELFEEVENFWIDETTQRDTRDYDSDWEFLAYKQIYDYLLNHSDKDYFNLLSDIVKPVGIVLYGEYDFPKRQRSMSATIGRSLSRSPIFKKRQIQGKNQYKVNSDKLKELLEAKGILTPIKEMLGR